PSTNGQGGPIRLVSVGRLDVYTKGLDILLDAFAAARASAPVELTVVGPDWNGGRAELERRAASLGLDGSLRFTGALAGSEAAADESAPDVTSLFSWDRIAGLHVDRYEEAC